MADESPPALDSDQHRRQAIEANNSVWELLDGRAFDPATVDELLGRAYAAAFHWSRATGAGPENAARASWLLSRCNVVLGYGELALHHADQCMSVVREAGLEDFDLGYAHEGRARALACLGRRDESDAERDAAASVPIADDEDREMFEADLAAEPWFAT